MDLSKIVRVTVKGRCYRAISSKYSMVEIFDDVAEESDFDDLYVLRALTSTRLLSTLPTNNNFIQSPFAYLNPEGSRFSGGTFGIFYAGVNEAVAIAETRYHRARFMLETNESAQEIDMRLIVAYLDARLYNLSKKQKTYSLYYHDSDYSASRSFGYSIFKEDGDGIRYSSVRHKDHEDVYAVFNESVLSRVRQSKNLIYEWDGALITHVYEKTLVES